MIPLLALFAPIFASVCFAASPFDFPENIVESSPPEERAIALDQGETVVDFDVSPLRAETAVVVKAASGKCKILFWKTEASRIVNIPDGTDVTAIVWHPLGESLFLIAGQEILRTPVDSWNPVKIYQSKLPLRRLVVGPRPFEMHYDEATKTYPPRYRVFFGVQKPTGYATHTVTEDGQREYAVLDSSPNKFNFSKTDDIPPNVQLTKSGLPAAFHPAGHFLLWEDGKHCFHKAAYAGDNWGKSTPASICRGSLTYTPNGAAILQWRKEMNGVTLWYGEKTTILAKNYRFLSTPSSVADGRGIVGVTQESGIVTVRYIPLNIPLADVVNAWMFLESPRDRELLSANTGLFRELDTTQLYQLYDTENYHCGGYDHSTPSRPYFVTTDIFWELYAAAFEGLFILSEKQAAVPRFWKFVEGGGAAAKPDSKLAKIFRALLAVRDGSPRDPESRKILTTESISVSTITGEAFNYGNLKPRGHYVAEPALQAYFRASKYLMDQKFNDADAAAFRELPSEVRKDALAWVRIYSPFIAPGKKPLVWDESEKGPFQVFPLSWGVDNEILYRSVYHRDFPEAEQIKGPGGLRLLPSGLDVAAVLGSRVAELILEETGELKRFPPLRVQIQSLKEGLAKRSKTPDTLYEKWLAGLATQWSESISSPGDVIQKKFWSKKRLQTGLASWATLRHATVLVNARSEAECGEAGFEPIILRPPRGYVEPDPATFEAIAGLFSATMDRVKVNGDNWIGNTPKKYSDPDQGLRDGILRRLEESRERVQLFAEIAKKEQAGQPLTNDEYEAILYVGRAAEHNFLIFKSLAKKDFALSTPDPIGKVADVAGGGGSVLLAGVGKPLEWDQIVPFFGRKIVVKGSAYSYYETVSKKVLTDEEWRKRMPGRPKWIESYFSKQNLTCPAKSP